MRSAPDELAWVVGTAKAAKLFDALEGALERAQERVDRAKASRPFLWMSGAALGGLSLIGAVGGSGSHASVAASVCAAAAAVAIGAALDSTGRAMAGASQVESATAALERMRGRPGEIHAQGHGGKALVSLGALDGAVARELALAAKSVGAVEVEAYLSPEALRTHRAAQIWEREEQAKQGAASRAGWPGVVGGASVASFQGQVHAQAAQLRAAKAPSPRARSVF